MRRFRLRLQTTLILAIIVAGCGAREAEPELKDVVPSLRPPNIVLVIGDDHGWPYYGFLGDENVVTPNLDSLAEGGALFTLGHVTANHCRPALQTLMTGLYPVQYEARLEALLGDLFADDEAFQSATPRERNARRLFESTRMMRRFDTAPALLAKAGYVSFQGGKWWEGAYQN
ncbi:MAG: sulfatase-like hydrolase/transferase, partial [Pseudomonadota bacterium]